MSAVPDRPAPARYAALDGAAAAAAPRHPLHAEDRVWVEKNCYIDLWIEVLGALALEPYAVMPFLVAMDFDGEQWTFFKPPHEELRDLYGLDVQELNVFRPLIEHVIAHLAGGRLVATEADSYWLPDTRGTAYRGQHTKTTIVIAELDRRAERVGYFHNAGYYTLDGEDYAQLFRPDSTADPSSRLLPLYAELIRIDRLERRAPPELRAMARALLHRHVAHRPRDNPVRRYQRAMQGDFPGVVERGLAYYHAWAFGTIRQFGAAFETLALTLRWLDAAGWSGTADAFDRISQLNKTLILKWARNVNSKRAIDDGTTFDELAAAWETGMQAIEQGLKKA